MPLAVYITPELVTLPAAFAVSEAAITVNLQVVAVCHKSVQLVPVSGVCEGRSVFDAASVNVS